MPTSSRQDAHISPVRSERSLQPNATVIGNARPQAAAFRRACHSAANVIIRLSEGGDQKNGRSSRKNTRGLSSTLAVAQAFDR